MVIRVAAACMAALSACLFLSACGGAKTTASQTPTRSTATTTMAVRPSTTSSPSPSQVASLAVAPDADRTLGAGTIQAAWNQLAPWILTNGFRAELMATTRPDEDALAPVYAFMTETAAADLRAKVQAVYDQSADPGTIDAIETITTIGVTVPGATLLTGEEAANNRTIKDATATLDSSGRLAITATSRALLHFSDTGDPVTRSHADYSRTVTYTLTQNGSNWAIDQWNGTYKTSTPSPD